MLNTSNSRPLPRVVITGANGLVGRAMCQQFPEAAALTRQDLDISVVAEFKKFDWSETRVIINAAGFVKTDLAETPEGAAAAWSSNFHGVVNLVNHADKIDAKIVHISSDYVFDGSLPDRMEHDTFSPLNVYGQTKVAADTFLLEKQRHHILRTAWVVGDGRNFVDIMLERAKRTQLTEVVNDQIGRLTFADDLARAVRQLLISTNAPAVINFTNYGPLASWADIAAKIFEHTLGETELVRSISSADYRTGHPHSAIRPQHSSLNLNLARAVLPMPAWTTRLTEYLYIKTEPSNKQT